MKVEIGQYREVNKGSLKAFFSVVKYPEGEKIIDCRHFVNGDEQWFSFPQKEVKRDGQKTEYIPYISYSNKEYLSELKESILKELKEKSNESSAQKNTDSTLPSETSFVW